MNKKVNILFATAEATPFVKVGGLGDVAGSLPQAIKAINPENIDIRIVLPFHQVIKDKSPSVRQVGAFDIPLSESFENIRVFVGESKGIPVYFLDNRTFTRHPGVYSADSELDGRKYALFSLGLLELARFLNWPLDLLHANDWHTALAVAALKDRYAHDPFFAKTKTLLTIHNLPFNGYGAQSAMQEIGFRPSADPDLPGWARYTPLPMGISAADKVVFVSKGYAQEVLHKEMGSGLDDYLRLHVKKIYGIINGIDINYWDPSTDPYISVGFELNDLAGKQVDKANLQQELGFAVNPEIPLLTTVSRLDNQKGLGILLEGLSRIVDLPWQLALLGTGDQALEEKALALQTAYPYRVSAALTYDEAYSHKLYAAADIFLMPSLYEPCGLSQMIAMRYGTIPVARATGGLVDTITNHFVDQENSTGFLFDQKTPEGFDSALRRALQVYTDTKTWKALQHRAMSKNYSWGFSAREYVDNYESLLSEVA